MREPKENLEGYLVAVQKLNECVGYIKQNSKAAIQLLEEAADTVMQPENIGMDNARVRRITDALAALKSHRAGEITMLYCPFYVNSTVRVGVVVSVEPDHKILAALQSHRARKTTV
jgi:hypothetical protein